MAVPLPWIEDYLKTNSPFFDSAVNLPPLRTSSATQTVNLPSPRPPAKICICGLEDKTWEVEKLEDPLIDEDGMVTLLAHWKATRIRLGDLVTGLENCAELVIGTMGKSEWSKQKQRLHAINAAQCRRRRRTNKRQSPVSKQDTKALHFKMRIGCLQFASRAGDIDHNLNRADAVLSRADVEDLDLLVLPGLAFSGSHFKSVEEMTPYLEPPAAGITSLWARTTALKYGCVVITSYPERLDYSLPTPAVRYHESVIIVDQDGESIANIRMAPDSTNATAQLPGLGTAVVGTSALLPIPENPTRLCLSTHLSIPRVVADVVIISMACPTVRATQSFTCVPGEPDMETLSYWIKALKMLIQPQNRKEIIVIIANCTGIDNDLTYAGTSTVLGIQQEDVYVYGLLARGEKTLLVVDTDAPACAKLVDDTDCSLNVLPQSMVYTSQGVRLGARVNARQQMSPDRPVRPRLVIPSEAARTYDALHTPIQDPEGGQCPYQCLGKAGPNNCTQELATAITEFEDLSPLCDDATMTPDLFEERPERPLSPKFWNAFGSTQILDSIADSIAEPSPLPSFLNGKPCSPQRVGETVELEVARPLSTPW